jgi:hypothetical protein
VTKVKADNLVTRYPRYPSTSSKAFFIQGSKTVPPLKKKLAQAITSAGLAWCPYRKFHLGHEEHVLRWCVAALFFELMTRAHVDGAWL